jgi:hypothetical protein
MLPIRITLAGCSTRSVIEDSLSSSSESDPDPDSEAASAARSTDAGTAPMGCPSGPITTTCCSCSSGWPDCSVMLRP